MNRKKRPPEGGNLRAVCPGLAAAKRNGPRQTRREYVGPAPGRVHYATLCNNYYIKFTRKTQAPIWTGGEVFPVSWEMLLTWIGAAALVRQFARIIEWIER